MALCSIEIYRNDSHTLIPDITDHTGLTSIDMGSGYWAEYTWPWSAYMLSLRYQSGTNGECHGIMPTQYLSVILICMIWKII
jgi:hypothetical protein